LWARVPGIKCALAVHSPNLTTSKALVITGFSEKVEHVSLKHLEKRSERAVLSEKAASSLKMAIMMEVDEVW
jgi:hypothetical protein